MLCAMSQPTNTSAPATPTLRPIQNQRENCAPARIATPIVMTTGQAIRPMNGLGKPKTDPCHESRFTLQPTSTPTLHDGTCSGSASTSTFSTDSSHAARRPRAPAITRKTAKATGRDRGEESGMFVLWHAASTRPCESVR